MARSETTDRDEVLEPFEAVVERHGPTVLRVCRAVVGPTDAEDAWSDTFLAALTAYPRLRPGSNVEAWLVTIAHRKAIDHVRAEARRAAPTGDPPEVPSTTDVPGGLRSDLWAALRTLPLKQRQTVAYHHLAGLPYAEVADIVGGTPDAARRSAADAVAALRRALAEAPDVEGPRGPGAARAARTPRRQSRATRATRAKGAQS